MFYLFSFEFVDLLWVVLVALLWVFVVFVCLYPVVCVVLFMRVFPGFWQFGVVWVLLLACFSAVCILFEFWICGFD